MKIQELFAKQKENLQYFFDHVDMEAADKLLRLLNDCKGIIFFTGVGKSGLVAKKIATTMTSVGIRALYLSPTDSLHGDIGLLSKEDVFILLSKSGESDELFHLLPFLRNKGATLISFVSDPDSRLSRACDMAITLPLKTELCPFGLMPTTSSAIQMIYGDILATALMMLREVKIEDYRANHPAGKIGRRMTLTVKDLMIHGDDLPLCHPEEKILDQIVQLSNKRCGCLLVVDDKGKLEGIFTDGDLRRALQSHGQEALQKPFREVMTPSPRSTTEETMAYDAMVQMEEDQQHPITVLAVTDKDKIVVGLIKMHDILQSGV